MGEGIAFNWLCPGKTRPLNPRGFFKIMRNASQWDNQDHERGNHQRARPENLSNLCECPMMERWPVAVALPPSPTVPGILGSFSRLLYTQMAWSDDGLHHWFYYFSFCGYWKSKCRLK